MTKNEVKLLEILVNSQIQQLEMLKDLTEWIKEREERWNKLAKSLEVVWEK